MAVRRRNTKKETRVWREISVTRKKKEKKKRKGNREYVVREGDTRGFRDRLLV